jgi:hypothetical protein
MKRVTRFEGGSKELEADRLKISSDRWDMHLGTRVTGPRGKNQIVEEFKRQGRGIRLTSGGAEREQKMFKDAETGLCS